jgi:Ca2+-binding RTX toxin-like protein
LTLFKAPINKKPIANDDTGFTANTAVPKTIDIATLLANDTDDDKGDILRLVAVDGAVGGSISIQGDRIVFDAEDNFTGTASFNYTIEDPYAKKDTAKVSIEVGKTLNGTPEKDSLVGTDAADTIFGVKGEDTLAGGKGDDYLDGGEDRDIINGGGDRDYLVGGGGNDVLNGGTGDDILKGGDGNDTYNYKLGDGRDSIEDIAGINDTLNFGLGITRANLSWNFNGRDLNFTFANSPSDRLTVNIFGNSAFAIERILVEGSSIAFNVGNGFSNTNEFAVVTSDAAAATAGASIVYNKNNSNLFYNQNGIAGDFGLGGQFATFTNNPNLAADDFVIQI